MTELEFQRAKRAHEQMTRAMLWERVTSWAKGVFGRRECIAYPDRSVEGRRRAALDRKAEVERKARQSL